MRKLMLLLAAVVFTALAGPRESQATTITTDAGWVNGDIFDTSDLLSFDFTLATAGVFSLTDCCTAGDIWTITGDILGASTFGLASIVVPLGIGDFPGSFDPAWLNASFSHFQLALAAGSYSIFVSGDGAGGVPASVGVRVDTLAPSAVPVPAGFGLLALGLGALGALRRRRGKVA